MVVKKLYRKLRSKLRRLRREPIKEEDKSDIFHIDADGYLRDMVGYPVSFPDEYGMHFITKSKNDTDIIINDNKYKIDL